MSYGDNRSKLNPLYSSVTSKGVFCDIQAMRLRTVKVKYDNTKQVNI